MFLIGWRSARHLPPRAATSMKTVPTISRIQAGFAVRRTSTARGRSTEPARIQMATPLIAMPMTVRRIVLRLIERWRRSSIEIGAWRARRSRSQLPGAADAQSMEEVASDHAQGREAVHDAALEADGARLFEIACRDRDLTDASAHPRGHDLGDELL